MIAEETWNGSTWAPARQYVNGTQYIDERVVMRDVAGGGVDHYYLLEELYSVAGMAASNGRLEEAVVYDTYGEARIYQWKAGDVDRNGTVTTGTGSDETAVQAHLDQAEPLYDLDLDGGNVDNDDVAIVTGQANETAQLATYSSFGNPYLFTGRTTDTLLVEEGRFRRNQDNRNRMYDPHHGRWFQRDPLGYVDGHSLYEYVRSATTVSVDPDGMMMPPGSPPWGLPGLPWGVPDPEPSGPEISFNLDPVALIQKYAQGGIGAEGVPIGFIAGFPVLMSVAVEFDLAKPCCLKGNCSAKQYSASLEVTIDWTLAVGVRKGGPMKGRLPNGQKIGRNTKVPNVCGGVCKNKNRKCWNDIDSVSPAYVTMNTELGAHEPCREGLSFVADIHVEAEAGLVAGVAGEAKCQWTFDGDGSQFKWRPECSAEWRYGMTGTYGVAARAGGKGKGVYSWFKESCAAGNR